MIGCLLRGIFLIPEKLRLLKKAPYLEKNLAYFYLYNIIFIYIVVVETVEKTLVN